MVVYPINSALSLGFQEAPKLKETSEFPAGLHQIRCSIMIFEVWFCCRTRNRPTVQNPFCNKTLNHIEFDLFGNILLRPEKKTTVHKISPKIFVHSSKIHTV